MEAKLVLSTMMELTSAGYWRVERFEIDSIDANTKIEAIPLPISSIKGYLIEVKVVCDSMNFDVHIHSQPQSVELGIDTVYFKEGIEKISLDTGLQNCWARQSWKDAQSAHSLENNLFLTFNNAFSAATGKIIIEIVYQTRF
jgi:hypothetical protein